MPRIHNYSLLTHLTMALLGLSLFLILQAGMASAGMFLRYHCYDENCQEGTKIDYTVYLENTAGVPLRFDNLVLVNKEFSIIVDYDVTEEVLLQPNETRIFNFTREVKVLPDNSYTLAVLPCFEVRHIDDTNTTRLYQFCAPVEYNIPVLPLARIQCNRTAECPGHQECFYFRCKDIKCGEGQVAANHGCEDLKACGWLGQNVDNQCVTDMAKLLVVFGLPGIAIILVVIIMVSLKSGKKIKQGKPKQRRRKTRKAKTG